MSAGWVIVTGTILMTLGMTINSFGDKQFDMGWKGHEKEINIQIEERIAQLEKEK